MHLRGFRSPRWLYAGCLKHSQARQGCCSSGKDCSCWIRHIPWSTKLLQKPMESLAACVQTLGTGQVKLCKVKLVWLSEDRWPGGDSQPELKGAAWSCLRQLRYCRILWMVTAVFLAQEEKNPPSLWRLWNADWPGPCLFSCRPAFCQCLPFS